MEGEQDVEMVDSVAAEARNIANEGSNGVESTQTETKPPQPEPDTGTPAEELDPDGPGSDAQPGAEQSPSEEPGSSRTTSSKVASLRAAFEQSENPPSPPQRRLTNGSSPADPDTEIARLKADLEKEKETRHTHETKISALEEELEDLTAQLEEQDEEWRKAYEKRQQKERLEAQERLAAVTEEARSQKQEAAHLQKQLSDLKKSVSASTRPSTHVSDVTFRDEVGILQHEVQNWIVQNFRRVKIDAAPEELCRRLEDATEERVYKRLEPMYKAFETSVKLPILQATVTCFLMEIFEEPYLFGLHGRVEWAERSRQAAEALLSVLQPAAYNRCRAVTFDALRQSESVKALVESSAHDIAQKITRALVAVTDGEENEARLTSLTTIMKRVVDLAHLIRVQQAKYEIVLPAPGERYDETCMDDVLEEDEDDVEHTIKFATFPAFFKTTDEEGRQAESRSVIVPAKVLCHDTED